MKTYPKHREPKEVQIDQLDPVEQFFTKKPPKG